MGVNSLPTTVPRQRRDCDLNPGRSAPESSTLTTRLPSHSATDQCTDREVGDKGHAERDGESDAQCRAVDTDVVRQVRRRQVLGHLAIPHVHRNNH